MDWTAPIDLYCERLTPDFWAEPFNAASNLAFIGAAVVGLIAARRSGGDRPVSALAALVAVIGLGSFLFHTFANRWSVLADVVPITLFIYAYLALALRRFFRLRWGYTVAWLILFASLSWPASAAARPLIGGSADYVPALAAMFVTGAVLMMRRDRTGKLVLGAACTFAISLALRTLDQPLCPVLPVGTHFLWHFMNAATLAILLWAAGRASERRV